MILLRRRTFVLGSALAGLAPAVAFAAQPRREFLPSPNFPDPDKIDLKFAEGYRPYRPDGYVIRGEQQGEKYLVHNYGHGGAGITTSWGSAQLVRKRLQDAGLVAANSSVAVIGSGVMGMTAASVLTDAKMNVTIYSRDTFDRTTSHVAGGQFAPADIHATDMTEFETILSTSYAEHTRRGTRFGVQPRMNYTLKPSDNLLRAVAASGRMIDFSDPQRHVAFRLNRLPFEHMNVGGYCYPTLLVEPPIFLARLHDELVSKGVKFTPLTIVDQNTVMGLPEKIVVNCLGASARLLVPEDTNLDPAHGIIALLPAQPQLKYLFSGIGYLFPREKDLVIGGSFQTGAEAGRLSSQDKARLMVKVARAVFEGALPMPEWLAGRDQTLYDSMLRSVEDD
jgi:glycine/D-amino acid oxidase-like deaminating enzyme